MRHRYYLAICFLLLLFHESCKQKDAKTTPVADTTVVHDTVFVNIDVNKKNVDSLEAVYGPFMNEANRSLLDQGESVSASIRLSVPLLPKNWVNDFDGLFTLEQEAVLNALISDYEKTKAAEIGVVTLDSTWANHDEVDAFVLNLHNAWGVGKRGRDNGILIGISESRRTVRVSNGEGISMKLTDAETDSIVKTAMLPLYAAGQYFEGTKKGIELMIKELNQ